MKVTLHQINIKLLYNIPVNTVPNLIHYFNDMLDDIVCY
jgi:hypothetical protein